MLAGASDVVEDTSTEELVVGVVAWAEETEDEMEDNVWEAEDADEELRTSQYVKVHRKEISLHVNLINNCLYLLPVSVSSQSLSNSDQLRFYIFAIQDP